MEEEKLKIKLKYWSTLEMLILIPAKLNALNIKNAIRLTFPGVVNIKQVFLVVCTDRMPR